MKSSFSVSIEGHALVNQRWFSIRFQSELVALCLELLFKRPSPSTVFRTANVVGLLDIYKRLVKIVLTAVIQSIYLLVPNNWAGRKKFV